VANLNQILAGSANGVFLYMSRSVIVLQRDVDFLELVLLIIQFVTTGVRPQVPDPEPKCTALSKLSVWWLRLKIQDVG
jgi:hypothetical protein